MNRTSVARLSSLLGAILVCAGSSLAIEISGTISSTLTLMDDSKLIGDVTCTVTGAPCIAFGASNITLDLNGFTMTGPGDPDTGCRGGPNTFAPGTAEDGIFVLTQRGAVIRGPGLIQRFRGSGVFSSNSNALTVTGVTISTNCLSGILVGGGSEHDLRNNVSVRNGNGNFPCGGI